MPRFATRLAPLLGALALAACSSGSSSEPGGPGGADGGDATTDSPAARPEATAGDDGAGDASAPPEASLGGDASDAGAGGDTSDARGADAAGDGSCATGKDGSVLCVVGNVPGECMLVSACAALGLHTSTAGLCPGPAAVECCSPTPDLAANPGTPAGYRLMTQSEVTAAMTAWAVMILNDACYPMFSEPTQTFGALLVMAVVEWHPPDFQNSAIHRGVTLYVHL